MKAKSLDDPVGKWIPELGFEGATAMDLNSLGHPMVKDLMLHTGFHLRQFGNAGQGLQQKAARCKSWMRWRRLAEIPLAFDPGTGRVLTSIDVLGS